jgi:hypothetical protein
VGRIVPFFPSLAGLLRFPLPPSRGWTNLGLWLSFHISRVFHLIPGLVQLEFLGGADFAQDCLECCKNFCVILIFFYHF